MKTTEAYTFKVNSDIRNINCIVKEIILYLQDLYGDISESIVYEIKVILNELITNAVKHGNKLDINRFVTISVGVAGDMNIFFIVEDEGEGYDYKCFMKCLNNNIQGIFELCNMKETGRGLFIVKSLSDSIRFNSKGNKIIVLKRINS